MKRIKVFSLALTLSLVGAIFEAGGYAQSTAQEPGKDKPSASCCASRASCCKEGASCCAKHKADGKQACAMNHKTGAGCCGEGANCCTGGECCAARKQ
jgi:hypothetical protein